MPTLVFSQVPQVNRLTAGTTMSSSDEHEEKNQDHRQSGRNYTIDLQAFSKSRIRLETELRNSDAAIEILDTYCTDGVKFDQVNPLIIQMGLTR